VRARRRGEGGMAAGGGAGAEGGGKAGGPALEGRRDGGGRGGGGGEEGGTGSGRGGTASDAASVGGKKSPPKAPSPNSLRTGRFLWYSSGVKLEEMVDGELVPPAYVYSVTGQRYRRRREPGEPEVSHGKPATVNGCAIVFFRLGDRAYACDAACPHRGGDLSLGDVEDVAGAACVTCPVHGYQFDLRSGESVAPPGYLLRTYPCRVSDSGEIEVAFSRLDDRIFEDDDF
jgi:nitrite reductase (NADH) small subunit